MAWADGAREVRYGLREQLRAGERQLASVLAAAHGDELVARVKLLWLLESLPGAGKVVTRRKLAELGLDGATPVGELNEVDVQRILDEFGNNSSELNPDRRTQSR